MTSNSAVSSVQVPSEGGHANEAAWLEVQGLTKLYAGHAAIEDVSLSIARGEFVTLLGPSGSGKTTLLMALAGFVQPDRGRVLLEGRDITYFTPEVRQFGMVFQGYALFPHMTVAKNVGFPLWVRGIPADEIKQRVSAMLDLVQLGKLGGRLPGQLSGGQQQRVALARALVFQPPILLLDEPLSALDKALRAQVQWELRALHRRLGTTFIYVTHDQEEALSMSDRIVILNHGRVQQIGSPRKLYLRPLTRFVASFLGESNFFSGRFVSREGDRLRVQTAAGVLQVACEADLGAGGSVTFAVRPERIRVSMEAPVGPNTVKGRVIDLKFLGDLVHVQVDCGALGTITASVSAALIDLDVPPSGEVYLSWPAEAGIVVRD